MTEEKQSYFNILAGEEFPEFILPYLETSTLKRLAGIGLFCGVDYNKMPMFDMKYWYSRLDHSIGCACITWHFTKDKTQTIAALLHDVGTPAFSHCVDFMLNDAANQESSERSVYETVFRDNELLKMLARDGVCVADVCFLRKYPIIENKGPKLCADRLESILSGGLVWSQDLDLAQIQAIYQDISVLKNETDQKEIGFNSEKEALVFFRAAMKQAFAYQSNEDKLSMHYIADILRSLILKNHIQFEDLFTLTEADIIEVIKTQTGPKLKAQWYQFTHLRKIQRHEQPVPYYYQINTDSKKRYVDPLFGSMRLSAASLEASNLLSDYQSFQDTPYASVRVPKVLFAYQPPQRKRARQQTNLIVENS